MSEMNGQVAKAVPYNAFSAGCPSRKLLQDVTRRWSLLILASLDAGPQRFCQLRHSVDGISERMLSVTLKLLQADGLVEHDSGEDGTYSVTHSGQLVAGQIGGLLESIYQALDTMDSSRPSSVPVTQGRA